MIKELIVDSSDHQVCYVGNFESALENVHDSISISVLDVYGESENPPLDTEVKGSDGSSAFGIISACN